MGIKIVRMLNGEDLLGEVLPRTPGSDPNSVSLKNPVRIIVMPNKIDPKTPNVGFAPWAEFSEDKTFTLDKAHIVCIMEPIKEFVKQYNSMFGGIIVNPNGPGLILPGA